MKYCADTWFLLALFTRDPKAEHILQETKSGKTQIIIPIIVYAESIKKMLQRGASNNVILEFYSAVESSEKVKIMLIDRHIAQEAAHISLSYSVPLVDSLIAATTRLTGCHALLSADQDYTPLVKKKYITVRSW